MSLINPSSNRLYSAEYKEFQKNEKFFSIPLFGKEVVKEFNEKLLASEIFILEAQTGAGKSVVAPIHIVKAFNYTKSIAMSEPRTINAVNIAGTLAKQLDSKVGEYVGYMTGVSSKKSKNTRLTVMTDAILFAQLLADPEAYQIVIIDEFHERNVNIDMCLAIAKKYYKAIYEEQEYHEWRESLSALSIEDRFKEFEKEEERIKEYKEKEFHPKNWKNPTKFILLSATIDADKYLKYYEDFKVSHMFVAGRSYPITDIFIDQLPDIPDTNQQDPNAWKGKTEKVIEKLLSDEYGDGDIIVFLPGKADIVAFVNKYEKIEGLMVGGIYRGAEEKRLEILTNATKYKELGFKRRLLFATNIAETGITIDGLRFVIETGIEKKVMDRSKFIELLPKKIPLSSAKQRCGRVGRTMPGTCFHMYTKEVMNTFRTAGLPAIYSENLKNLIIKLMVVIDNRSTLTTFLTKDIIDPLRLDDVEMVFLDYYKHDLIVENKLSLSGLIVGKIGLDYNLSLLFLTSFKYRVQELMTAIVAMMSLGSLRDFCKGTSKEVDRKLSEFKNEYGEPIAYLRLFIRLFNAVLKKGGKNDIILYCSENGFNHILVSDIMGTIKGIQDKLNEVVKGIQPLLKDAYISTWRVPIPDFYDEEFSDDLKDKWLRIVAVFGEIFLSRAIYVPFEKVYRTETGVKIAGTDLGPTIDLGTKPSYIGFSEIIKIGDKFLPIWPFVIIKKEDLD